MVRSTRAKRSRNQSGSGRNLHSSKFVCLAVEPLEDRHLMAASDFLQGYAYVDKNANNTFDAGDSPKVGATIQLYDSTGTILQSSTTTNSDGYYRFDGVPPGTHVLKEVAPGFATMGVQIQSLFDPAS